MKVQADVYETIVCRMKYMVEADDLPLALSKLRNGETIEEEQIGGEEVVHREIIDSTLKIMFQSRC